MALPRALEDRLHRPLFDLRVSVTDRCNFRCTYCMPRDKVEGASFLPRAELLSFEEIARAAKVFVSLGVRKIRLTGGEPLLRRELPRLVRMLQSLDVELALTTNGVLLPKLAAQLKDAGLHRLTVSLDALDPAVFQRVCDAPGFGPQDVLAGIQAASGAGFSSIKINCAVRRGENEGEVAKIARYFAGSGHIVRFIEFMDVGTRNGWEPRAVVSASEIRALLSEVDELVALPANYRGEVAQRYKYAGGAGEVGIIASVSEPFCGDCSRARMSADGSLYACLFARQGFDLRAALRGGSSEEELRAAVTAWWREREDRYSELRAQASSQSRGARHLPLVSGKVEMSFIGG
jgi:cyclic pyranopterin phosphate synthase